MFNPWNRAVPFALISTHFLLKLKKNVFTPNNLILDRYDAAALSNQCTSYTVSV